MIDRYIEAYHKVAEHHQELLKEDNSASIGGVALTQRKS